MKTPVYLGAAAAPERAACGTLVLNLRGMRALLRFNVSLHHRDAGTGRTAVCFHHRRFDAGAQ
jgi:hypothetical protein